MEENKEIKSEVIADSQDSKPVEKPNYTPEQVLYLSGLQTRLQLARDNKNTAHDEFDGMDYDTRYEDEERIANSYIPPKKNKSDTNFISGTIRQKMLALLAAINMLNLEPDDTAFDKDNVEINELGNAINIVREKCAELDEDEEKKMMRQMELLKHGTVFVEDTWRAEWRKEKTLNKKFTGQANGISWSTQLKKVYEYPCRTVLDGRSVYLGDIRQPFIKKQPYLFTIDDISYDDAKSIYGEWDMWKYVNKKLETFAGESSKNASGIAYANWRLLNSTQENRVEIIKYQDRTNNEFQILLNGIPMLPVGFPMPWKHGEYNITQQNLEFIHPHFAYGRSFVSRLKVQAALLDELLRLAILKVQKSFMPPRANQTGRVLSKNVFMPGSITMGLNPDQVKVLSEKDGEGLMRGELEGLKILSENIDNNSVNPTFAGQQTKGNPTATEILELQRQAKMVLGLTVFSMAMMEKKLGMLRRDILLENWFNPVDTKLDKARGLVNQYRVANIQKSIPGEGMGNMMVIPTDDGKMFPIDQENMDMMGEQIYKEEEAYSTPTRKIYVNAEVVKDTKIIWKTVVNPTETGGSERSKLLFERMATAANSLGIVMNPDELIQRFAETWQENPKLFQGQPPMAEGVVAAGMKMPGGKKPGMEQMPAGG